MPRRPCTVKPVEDALVARLAARTALADTAVQVTLPLAGKVPSQNDRIYLLGVQDVRREHLTDQRAKRETYRLPLWVEVYRPCGDEPGPVRDRFWTIVEEIEAELELDPELANIADDAWVEEILEANALPTSDGWIMKSVLYVRVLAVV
jgi:hypothetical protein